MTDLTSSWRSLAFSTQGSFQRCPGVLPWMASIQHPDQLWIEDKLLNSAWPLLPERWLPYIQHNEVCDVIGSWLSEVCHDLSIEPHSQPIRGELLAGASANTQHGTKLDIAANGFWGGRFKRTYFDVRVFNSHAPTNRQQSLAFTYKKHKKIKIRAYSVCATFPWGGAWLLHPLGHVPNWWGKQCCNHLLQETSVCFQRSGSRQHNTGLEVKQVILCPPALFNPMRSGHFLS